MQPPLISKGKKLPNSLTCISCDGQTIGVSDKKTNESLLDKLTNLYRASTQAGHNATEYWADIAVNSDHPMAPLANIPGVFSALWTPEVAPQTTLTLGSAGLGFVSLPKSLVHFTTAAGARGITTSARINASRFGLFGPGVYLASTGRPLNLFVRAQAKIPISVSTPSGTVRIIPRLVYVRWGLSPILVK